MNTLKYWSNKDSVDAFKIKRENDYFLTEKHLFSKISYKFKSVLDVGCATGNLINLLSNYSKKLDYTGIDIVEEQIRIAKKQYSKFRFINSDLLQHNFRKKFDLVNATGLIQHSANYIDIIKKMINLSSKYVIFDIKISKLDKNFINLKDTYIKVGSNKIPYIIFSQNMFNEELKKIKNINKIYFYGYPTHINKNAKIPIEIKKVISVGYLIEKSNLIKKINISGKIVNDNNI